VISSQKSDSGGTAKEEEDDTNPPVCCAKEDVITPEVSTTSVAGPLFAGLARAGHCKCST
jgi:hypothetical protein